MNTSFRDTWAEVSLNAIGHNTALFKARLSSECKLMAVVKADGYGHGAAQIARAALGAGADYLSVAFLDEAIHLREAGIRAPILILGYTPPRSVEMAIRNDITLTVYTNDVLEEIITCTKRLEHTARIHIKVDTGMSRLGVQTIEEALALATIALASEHIILEGLFTHLADADNEDDFYITEQFNTFMNYIYTFKEQGITIPLKHCCNSAAAIRSPHMHLDMVRIGIALYGLFPAKWMNDGRFPLRQAMSLKTRIAAVRVISSKQPVSYGCTFIPNKESVIATIPIGYADGLSRQLSNKGYALLQGERVPIAGRVCMDQTMLDVTALRKIEAGDVVTMFGWADEHFLSIDEIAALMGTLNYEVVCLIGKRVPRVYR
nr:alanine racemase [Paenibacillus sp. GSMTC-2017]